MNLEKNLQDQNKEIAFLKLSLKEVQDRLKAVEDSLLQSKPKRQSIGALVYNCLMLQSFLDNIFI